MRRRPGNGDDESIRLASSETAVVFVEIYRNGADWKFRAVGQGCVFGLTGIATDFGATV